MDLFCNPHTAIISCHGCVKNTHAHPMSLLLAKIETFNLRVRSSTTSGTLFCLA